MLAPASRTLMNTSSVAYYLPVGSRWLSVPLPTPCTPLPSGQVPSVPAHQPSWTAQRRGTQSGRGRLPAESPQSDRPWLLPAHSNREEQPCGGIAGPCCARKRYCHALHCKYTGAVGAVGPAYLCARARVQHVMNFQSSGFGCCPPLPIHNRLTLHCADSTSIHLLIIQHKKNTQSKALACTVLPSPMSSARMPFSPLPHTPTSQRRPCSQHSTAQQRLLSTWCCGGWI
jgi:hypothetical protein